MTKKLAQALVMASLSAGASGTVPSAADAFIKAAMAELPPAGSAQASGILVTSRLSPQMSQLAPSSDPSITQILLEIKSHVSQNSGGRAQVTENQIDYFLVRDKGQPYTVAKKLYWDLFDIAVMALDSDEVKKDLKAAEAAGVKAILPRAIRVRFFMGYQTSAALQSFHTWSAMFELPKVYYNNELLNSGVVLYPLSDPERQGPDGESNIERDHTWIRFMPANGIPPDWRGHIQEFLDGQQILPPYYAQIEQFLENHRGK